MTPLLAQLLRNAKRLAPMAKLLKNSVAFKGMPGMPGSEGLRQPQTLRQPREPVAPPAGGQRLQGTHAAATGARDYRLFLPDSALPGPMPLVVMLHGCTQTPDDFAAGTRMDEAAQAQGFAVLYPAQSRSANPQGCWQWFKHSHQQRGRGEPAIVAGMVQELVDRHGLDASRIYVAGLSAGGAMAAILGTTHPEIFAAVGVHSGLPAGAAHDLPSAMAAMQSGAPTTEPDPGAPPTIVFHGDADATVHPRNGVLLTPGRAETHSTPVPHRESGGRKATRTLYRDARGQVIAEHWQVHGAGHAWAGGSAKGSYTDPQGPDATAEMLRFFFEQRLKS